MLFKTETLKYQYGNHKNSNAAKGLLNKKGNFWHRTEMSNYRKLFKIGVTICKYKTEMYHRFMAIHFLTKHRCLLMHWLNQPNKSRSSSMDKQ
jgi:hypothetical protein